jgi:hypothetical protein
MQRLVQRIHAKDIDVPLPPFRVPRFDFAVHIEETIATFIHQVPSRCSFFDYFVARKRRHFKNSPPAVREFFGGLLHFLQERPEDPETKFYLFLLANRLTRTLLFELSRVLRLSNSLSLKLKHFYDLHDLILWFRSVLRLTDGELFDLKQRLEKARMNGDLVNKAHLRLEAARVLQDRMSKSDLETEVEEPLTDTKYGGRQQSKSPAKTEVKSHKKGLSCFRFDFSVEKGKPKVDIPVESVRAKSSSKLSLRGQTRNLWPERTLDRKKESLSQTGLTAATNVSSKVPARLDRAPPKSKTPTKVAKAFKTHVEILKKMIN